MRKLLFKGVLTLASALLMFSCVKEQFEQEANTPASNAISVIIPKKKMDKSTSSKSSTGGIYTSGAIYTNAYNKHNAVLGAFESVLRSGNGFNSGYATFGQELLPLIQVEMGNSISESDIFEHAPLSEYPKVFNNNIHSGLTIGDAIDYNNDLILEFSNLQIPTNDEYILSELLLAVNEFYKTQNVGIFRSEIERLKLEADQFILDDVINPVTETNLVNDGFISLSVLGIAEGSLDYHIANYPSRGNFPGDLLSTTGPFNPNAIPYALPPIVAADIVGGVLGGVGSWLSGGDGTDIFTGAVLGGIGMSCGKLL